MTHEYTRRMVWAFIGQMTLIVSLFAFIDCFPSWVLKVMVAATFLLPIGAYITIAVRPPVYHAWQSTLHEMFEFGSSCITELRGCFRLRTILRVWQFVTTLRAFPGTADEWGALFLFPFKLYVLMALPFLWLSVSVRHLIEPRFAYVRFAEATYAVSEGYVLCLAILLVGALVQALFSHRGRSSQTLLMFALGVLFLRLLRPWGMFG
jgi:hypothetical protein